MKPKPFQTQPKFTVNALSRLSHLDRQTVIRRLTRGGLKTGRGIEYPLDVALPCLVEPDPPPTRPGARLSLSDARAKLAQARADSLIRQAELESGVLVSVTKAELAFAATERMLTETLSGLSHLGHLLTNQDAAEVSYVLGVEQRRLLDAVRLGHAGFLRELTLGDDGEPTGILACFLEALRQTRDRLGAELNSFDAALDRHAALQTEFRRARESVFSTMEHAVTTGEKLTNDAKR